MFARIRSKPILYVISGLVWGYLVFVMAHPLTHIVIAAGNSAGSSGNTG